MQINSKENRPSFARRDMLQRLALLVGSTLSAPVLTAFAQGVPGNVPGRDTTFFTADE